jgi:hypothetical protein
VSRGHRWSSEPERFWLKVDRQDQGECWRWTGAVAGGYGRFWIGPGRARGRPVQAHRFAYELLVGPIPDGLTIDHLCLNKLCVNPAHMEPVTGAENSRRARRVQLGQLPKRLPTLTNGACVSDASPQ